MHIWVDGDACPKTIKDILFRTAERVSIPMTLVANRRIRIPHSSLIKFQQVPDGLDVTDHYIVHNIQSGDLVITADIPLAASAVEKGCAALNPRGTLYTKDNIGEHLSMRNFMDELRGTGIQTGGPSSFGLKDREMFANALNRFITNRMSG